MYMWQRLFCRLSVLLLLVGSSLAHPAPRFVQAEPGASLPPPPPSIYPADLAVSPDDPTYQATCADGEQPGGARYRICLPSGGVAWNGELMAYMDGLRFPTEPITTTALLTGIEDAITARGYAYVTTSVRRNGINTVEGMQDLLNVLNIFADQQGTPTRTYLIGLSGGGLVATQAAEQYGDLFEGVLALCAPYPGLAPSLNQAADFRVVFDYFFPDLLPSSPISVPTSLIANWNDTLQNEVIPTITNITNLNQTVQLIAVSNAVVDPADQNTSAISTTATLLTFHTLLTNDAREQLGGSPYDNQETVYSGSGNDEALNAGVVRFSADMTATTALSTSYSTTGQITVPLVTLHTTLDPLVRYADHAPVYAAMVAAAGQSDIYRHTSVERYGHCNFTAAEVNAALDELIALSTPVTPTNRLYLPLIRAAPVTGTLRLAAP